MSNVFVTIEHDAELVAQKLEAFIKDLVAKIEAHGHKSHRLLQLPLQSQQLLLRLLPPPKENDY